MGNILKILVRKSEGRDHLGDRGEDGCIILKLNLTKNRVWDGVLDSCVTKLELVVESCKHGNELSA
jgi:hypothetical protein